MTGDVNALEFYFNESAAEQSITSSAYTDKVGIGFTPAAAANYTVIAAAEANHSSGGAGEFVGAALVIDGIVHHEILYRPKDLTDWFPFSAVKRIALNTSQHNITIRWNATSTGFIRNARIAVMQIDSEYNESEDATTTSSTTPVEKSRLNFTPASAGSYLIMASANIQNSATGRAAPVNLYIDGTEYMECRFEQRDLRNRYGCATIKNITLNASEVVLNLTFKTNNAADTATIKNAHLIAVRLDSFNKSYYNESESETSPAAANNWYNKTVNSYSTTPGRHLILGSAEHQSGTTTSNKITFYNGTTKSYNVSLEATDTTDWAAPLFITVANLTSAFQSDRIEHSATGGTLSNFGIKRARLISVLLENSTPVMRSVSASPSPIKGGNVVTITGAGIDDPNGQTLNLYCSESSSTPTAASTICTGGTITDTTRPYGLTCTYAVTADDALHTSYCRAFDNDFYSYAVNTTFVTDSSPPATSVADVAGDADITYYDKTDDGWTNMTINGEAGMACRWGTSDIVYGSMANDCTISGSQATCPATTTTQGLDAYNFYVSCQDSLGNSQNTTQNLDIVSLVTDWTAPTTSDNSSSSVQVPPYYVAITENDNLEYGFANIQTKFCTDTSNSCTPSTAIDSGGVVTFTSSSRGTNFLRYNSSDPAGNIQSVQSKTISINQLPVLTSAADNAATIKGGSAVTVTTFSSDADSGQTLNFFVCNSTSVSSAGCNNTYCSNATTSPNASCVFNSENNDAAHTWYAFLYDSLNETASFNASGTYTTDSTGPSITVINPANQTHPENSVTAQLGMDEAVSWSGYSLDGAANVTMVNSTPTFWSAAISGLSNSGHTLLFYANDSYGNMGTSSRIFSVDTTLTDTSPPTITVWSPVNGTYYSSASVLANITLSESGSSASYSINGTANVSMSNISLASWNATIAPADGPHTIMFYANDTSANKNAGNSSLVYFFIDTAAPQNILKNNTPLSPDENTDITCYSQWSDNVALDYGYMEHNETGTAINSSLISLGSSWINYTISSANTTPGTVQCKAYAFDKAGRVNTTTWTISVSDVTSPAIENVTYLPNTTDSLDPNVMVNLTAFVSDNVSVSSVVVQYRLNTSDVWLERLMSPVTTAMYSGNFTPAAGNWSFRIYANDTSGNVNATPVTNITVSLDYTWLNMTTVAETKAIIRTDPREISLGNITINNTADFDLNFTITSDSSWILFNRTNTSMRLIVNSTFNKTTFNVTANTTGFAVGTYAYSITIAAYTINPTLISSQTINGTVVIQNVAGPLFEVAITSYDATVTHGDSGIVLTATLSNLGTSEATGAWFNWSLPSGWANTSGSINDFIGFLGVGSRVTSNITISVNSSAATGTHTISAVAGSNEAATGSDSRTVSVNSASSPSSPSSGSSSGGGITAPATSAATPEQKALLLQTEETLELVRGLNDTFEIKVTNPFRNSVMKNVVLDVKGFLAQYVSTSPERITEIPYNETGLFRIAVTAPAYLTKGEHPLNFTIKGRLVEGASERDIIEQRFVTLSVHEISRADANETLEQAAKYYQEMLAADIPAAAIKKLLDQAKTTFEKRDYEKVNEITGLITLAKDTAFSARNSVQELMHSIKDAESRGLRVDGTKNLLNLALAAFEREDYASAAQRVRDAQLIYAIETGGRINYAKFLMDYWWAVATLAAAACVVGAITYRRVAALLIAKKLKDLSVEEENITKLMKQSQRKVYVEKTMSATDYRKSVRKYESRLSEIREERARLRSRRIGIIKASKEMENLKKEDDGILNLMKTLQREYFEKRSMKKSVYSQRMEAYKARKTEIEEALAVLETRLARKSRPAARKKSGISRLLGKWVRKSLKKKFLKKGAGREKHKKIEIPNMDFNRFFSKIKKPFEKSGEKLQEEPEELEEVREEAAEEAGEEKTIIEIRPQTRVLEEFEKTFVKKPGAWLRRNVANLEGSIRGKIGRIRSESIKQALYKTRHYYKYSVYKPSISDKMFFKAKKLIAKLRLKVS
ncbi:MAG: hypothetical protein HY516_01985 [Candidatus Aenigmarchaeota archaeon]|nr:hypothetical protein [Candidatus Aenigmarchaeota archaeon]